MTFDEWKSLSETDRNEIARDWNPYNTEDQAQLLEDLGASFQDEHPHLAYRGLGNVFGSLMLVVMRPFIFDRRKAPGSYMGLGIRYTLSEQTPEGFDQYAKYIWAPENYVNFVNARADDIRDALGDPEMDKEEMLHALVGMPFDDWIRQCQKWGNTQMHPRQRRFP